MTNLEPSPGLLSAQSSPPCFSAMSRQIRSPRPTPSPAVIFARAAVSIPLPVSRTHSRTWRVLEDSLRDLQGALRLLQRRLRVGAQLGGKSGIPLELLGVTDACVQRRTHVVRGVREPLLQRGGALAHSLDAVVQVGALDPHL